MNSEDKPTKATFKQFPTIDIFEMITAPIPQSVYDKIQEAINQVEEWRVDTAKKLRDLLKENGDSLSMKYTREQIIRMLLESLK